MSMYLNTHIIIIIINIITIKNNFGSEQGDWREERDGKII